MFPFLSLILLREGETLPPRSPLRSASHIPVTVPMVATPLRGDHSRQMINVYLENMISRMGGIVSNIRPLVSESVCKGEHEYNDQKVSFFLS